MKDSIWNRNPAKFLKECQRLRALCARIIDDSESVIEGSRKMLWHMFLLKEEENGNWNIFRVVDDQSHHHPIGNARQFWAADVLTVKDHEIEQLEDLYRPKVKEAAQVIRKEYEKHVE